MDLTAGRMAALSAPLRNGLLVGALGLFLIVVGLTGAAGVELAGCVAAGAGLTYLSGLPLQLEERLAYGAVVGAMAVTTITFLLALGFGLGAPTVLLGLAAGLAAGGAAWWPHRAQAGTEARELGARWRRREPWPLWLLLLLAWPFTLVLLAGAYRFTGQGLISGGAGVYGDWAAHLTFTGSFAFAHNLPPQFPIDPGHRMAYPFMVDFMAAALVALGTSLTSSLVLTSGLLGLAFPAVMYLAGARLTGNRAGAALAVLVFCLSGGLGFVFLAGDLQRLGPAALEHLPRLYTQAVDLNFQWLNPVLAWMLPQRSVLFGFAVALIVVALLWSALPRPGWAPFASAGVLAGITPLFHLHAWGTVVALAAIWALADRRRQWLAYFAPALLLGLPAAVWMAGAGTAQPHVQLGWLANSAGHQDGPVWFWLKNTSLLVPAMLAGFAWRGLLPPRLALALAPIWLWFLLPNLVVFQPWDWDNTKFFAYWALLGALPVGALLARLLGGGWGWRLIGAGLAVSLMLAGGLDLARALDSRASSSVFTDPGGLAVAAWVRASTPPDAIFLVAPEHNEPVPTLGGRRIVAGYPGWLASYGLTDWIQRTGDADRMLQGGPGTPALIRGYGVGYVVLGPQELYGHHASQAYWQSAADPVFRGGGYSVYRIR